jgi:hypothetical protein
MPAITEHGAGHLAFEEGGLKATRVSPVTPNQVTSCPRRLADDRDAFHIDFELRRMRLHPADRRGHILRARRPVMLRREAVIDREPHKARLRQRLEQWRDERMFFPLREPALMHQDARRKRAAAFRYERIQRQRYLARLHELNVLL